MFGIYNAKPQNFLVQAVFQLRFQKYAVKYLSGKLLDIGCGKKPYQALLASLVEEHIGIDHKESLHTKEKVDLEGTAYQIPVENESFDSAICTAVLEHLEEPLKALQECNRVLKDEGMAIYSIPFIWHLHEEPRDFYRYSKYGIQYLFNKARFEIVELEALSGFWITFGQLFVYNLYRLNHGPLRWFKVIEIIGFIIQGVAFLLDKVDKTEKWTWMYLVVAKKTK